MKTYGKPALSLREHNDWVIAEVKSSLNLWATGEELRRSPNLGHREDRNKLVLHYIKHGGIARLARDHCIMEEHRAWVVFMIAVSWCRQRAALLLRKGNPHSRNLR